MNPQNSVKINLCASKESLCPFHQTKSTSPVSHIPFYGMCKEVPNPLSFSTR